MLGEFYLRTDTKKNNIPEAARWYRLAADNGVAHAQFALARMYATGEGVPKKDFTEAARLYQLAADQEHAAARFFLGVCYARGEGVPTDLVKAAQLCELEDRLCKLFAELQNKQNEQNLNL